MWSWTLNCLNCIYKQKIMKDVHENRIPFRTSFASLQTVTLRGFSSSQAGKNTNRNADPCFKMLDMESVFLLLWWKCTFLEYLAQTQGSENPSWTAAFSHPRWASLWTFWAPSDPDLNVSRRRSGRKGRLDCGKKQNKRKKQARIGN